MSHYFSKVEICTKSAKAYIKGLEKINSEKTDILFVNSWYPFL